MARSGERGHGKNLDSNREEEDGETLFVNGIVTVGAV